MATPIGSREVVIGCLNPSSIVWDKRHPLFSGRSPPSFWDNVPCSVRGILISQFPSRARERLRPSAGPRGDHAMLSGVRLPKGSPPLPVRSRGDPPASEPPALREESPQPPVPRSHDTGDHSSGAVLRWLTSVVFVVGLSAGRHWSHSDLRSSTRTPFSFYVVYRYHRLGS